jgi:WD40 repeat protein
MLATASYDETVKLWRRDGSLFKTLKGIQPRLGALVLVLMQDDCFCQSRWNCQALGQQRQSDTGLFCHKNYMVTSVSFSLDGRIATASDDKTVKLCDGRRSCFIPSRDIKTGMASEI